MPENAAIKQSFLVLEKLKESVIPALASYWSDKLVTTLFLYTCGTGPKGV